MIATETNLPGVLLVEPRVWTDERGFFFESYNRRDFREAGIDVEFVQDNQSRSRRDTIRGLHYQEPPHAQDKLVRTVTGKVYDVVVDLRLDSPAYGQWQAFTLSAANHLMLFVPSGFAHGFCVLSESADVLYKCSALYAAEASRGLRWDDETLAIDWPVESPILSDQDWRHPAFLDLHSPFRYDPEGAH